jgi:hypothetical protein
VPNWKLATPDEPEGFTVPFSKALELVMFVAVPVATVELFGATVSVAALVPL